jgi:hypothetical protein
MKMRGESYENRKFNTGNKEEYFRGFIKEKPQQLWKI